MKANFSQWLVYAVYSLVHQLMRLANIIVPLHGKDDDSPRVKAPEFTESPHKLQKQT